MKWLNFKFPENISNGLNHLFGKIIPLAFLTNLLKTENWIVYPFIVIFILSFLLDLFKKYNELRVSNVEIKSREKKEQIKNDFIEYLVESYKNTTTLNSSVHSDGTNLEKILKLLSNDTAKALKANDKPKSS